MSENLIAFLCAMIGSAITIIITDRMERRK